MRQLRRISVVSLFLIIGSITQAQTYKDNENTAMENIRAKTFLYNVVAQNSHSASVNNATRVQQIGSYNNSVSLTKSTISNINLTQFGNRNDINLMISSSAISEDVLQIGKNNSFSDLSPNPKGVHAANVVQFGTNQNLIWLGGQNSISDKMMVNMQGKNQTVIVRNLNK